MAPRKTIYGYNRQTWTIPVDTLALQGTAANVLETWTPGFYFEIEKVDYVVKVAHTCAGAGTRTFTVRKGTSSGTAVATITLTHANSCAARGTCVAQATLTTADASFLPTDTLSISYATGTAFTAGDGAFLITVRVKPQTAG